MTNHAHNSRRSEIEERLREEFESKLPDLVEQRLDDTRDEREEQLSSLPLPAATPCLSSRLAKMRSRWKSGSVPP
jgi:hypothetical protein